MAYGRRPAGRKGRRTFKRYSGKVHKKNKTRKRGQGHGRL